MQRRRDFPQNRPGRMNRASGRTTALGMTGPHCCSVVIWTYNPATTMGLASGTRIGLRNEGKASGPPGAKSPGRPELQVTQ